MKSINSYVISDGELHITCTVLYFNVSVKLYTHEMYLLLYFTYSYIRGFLSLSLSIVGIGICQDHSQTPCTVSTKTETETPVWSLHWARSILGGPGRPPAGHTGTPQKTSRRRKAGGGTLQKTTCCLRRGAICLNSPRKPCCRRCV